VGLLGARARSHGKWAEWLRILGRSSVAMVCAAVLIQTPSSKEGGYNIGPSHTERPLTDEQKSAMLTSST
jgi:hypothetical protein